MTNPFRDQEKFMKACDQSTDKFNVEQFNLYLNLIKEEGDELATAVKNMDTVETLDALTDILVVVIIILFIYVYLFICYLFICNYFWKLFQFL